MGIRQYVSHRKLPTGILLYGKSVHITFLSVKECLKFLSITLHYLLKFLPSSVLETKLPFFLITSIIKLFLSFGTSSAFALFSIVIHLSDWNMGAIVFLLGGICEPRFRDYMLCSALYWCHFIYLCSKQNSCLEYLVLAWMIMWRNYLTDFSVPTQLHISFTAETSCSPPPHHSPQLLNSLFKYSHICTGIALSLIWEMSLFFLSKRLANQLYLVCLEAWMPSLLRMLKRGKKSLFLKFSFWLWPEGESWYPLADMCWLPRPFLPSLLVRVEVGGGGGGGSWSWCFCYRE